MMYCDEKWTNGTIHRFAGTFIGDTGSYRIRMVNMERNLVYTVAGNGNRGSSVENGPALKSSYCSCGLGILLPEPDRTLTF